MKRTVIKRKGEAISYFDFKLWYYRSFPRSTYRYGQALFYYLIANQVCHNSELNEKLYEEEDNQKAEDLFFSLTAGYNWDMMNLVLVQDLIK